MIEVVGPGYCGNCNGYSERLYQDDDWPDHEMRILCRSCYQMIVGVVRNEPDCNYNRAVDWMLKRTLANPMTVLSEKDPPESLYDRITKRMGWKK